MAGGGPFNWCDAIHAVTLSGDHDRYMIQSLSSWLRIRAWLYGGAPMWFDENKISAKCQSGIHHGGITNRDRELQYSSTPVPKADVSMHVWV